MTQVARTPSSFPSASLTEALLELEFPKALDRVARFTVSDLGADAVRARRPSTDLAWIRHELATVGELMHLLRDDGAFAPEPVPDITDALQGLAAPGSVLEAEAFVRLGRALQAMRLVGRSLQGLEHDAPRVHALLVELPPKSLDSAIERTFEPDGTVKDTASPELKHARRRVRELRAKLIAQLESRLHEIGAGAEGQVTLRGGRYVIPVRRDVRGRVKGIVHAASGSGATVFLEPEDAVELGNDLNEAEADEVRAVLAVLRGLTDRARPLADAIHAGWEMCIAADDLYARVRFARAMDAVVPGVEPGRAGLRISVGRHPLLGAATANQPNAAVPFSLDLTTARTLVISGPNAGGKTVLLKAVGLICALTQAGIVPPVGEGTTLPVFQRLFVDIGDHQSIAASLSTFSAHLTALRGVLEHADGTSLVLLDELGGGTDPIEGGALAGAVILSLHARGAVTLATTHLTPLKELAADTDGVLNASLEFDADTLTPTYRLLIGKPGRSYGLAMARRLGLPDDVLATADALTPEEIRTLDATLAALERREAELAEREATVARLEAELANAHARAARDRQRLDTRLAQVQTRELELEKAGREQARRFLLEARKRVEEALGVARAAVSEATATEARRLVEEGVQQEADALKKLEQAARAKGWKVRGTRCAVRGDDRADTEAPISGSDAGSAKTAHRAPRTAHPSETEIVASSEIDIRGMRADEAEAAVLSAVDAAIVAALPSLRIIHGKGTGALRAVVQELLQRDRRVRSFAIAPPQQGGGGVTIVELTG